MISMLRGWQGKATVNGTVYNDINSFISLNKAISGEFSIKLHSNVQKTENKADTSVSKPEYKITVKQYMTKQADPTFDFMAKWNDNVPMPLRTMVGHVIQETKGMYKMELHGDILAEKTCHCMKCGKELKNPVSQYFGIGPECGNHGYVNPFETEEELKQAVESYRKQLQSMTWTGWVIKSAITEMEEVK